ncbi:phosphotransferase [Parvibaculum sp.]|uniref:phosphotransferase n=1 Tax=Parvibaculum sp. TaxID=2024848 RepID=UPI001B0F8562|nr:phosphotransferase [Parvibaculum sp.]MBO6633235.1 phosphotransferase [Parvibaculum sp.]MBO6678018.1 phosphotransferase [Parvibaculum sp.]MBO6683351.1 phosphotransferase [Parvibaculum sp.]MBO6906603.1 phosphotransferase [Parvibaculum sp.]
MGETLDLPIVASAAVTPEWMTGVLRKAGHDVTVSGVTGKRVGTGQVGESVRFTLSYKGDPKDAPATVVGKFPSSDPESRATGVNFGNYIREVNFYRELADSAGLTTPVCHHADVDPETSDFVLIMEDLAPAVPGDQMKGTTVKEAALVLEEAAKFHASHWNDEALDNVEWLFETKAAPKRTQPDLIRLLWQGFRERYGERIPADCIEIGEAITRNYEFFKDGYDGPKCLTHNDFRPDNMMFSTAEGGYPIAVVDWQSVGYGCCMADVSYFLSGALKREERNAHEHELLTTYHRRLKELGVSGYSREEMMKHYALYSFSLFNMAFTASMIVERTERGDNMFFQMLRGGADHVLDTGALDLLPE